MPIKDKNEQKRYFKIWRLHNLKYLKKYAKTWIKNHPEYHREYFKIHREHYRNYVNEYRKKFPEIIHAREQKYRDNHKLSIYYKQKRFRERHRDRKRIWDRTYKLRRRAVGIITTKIIQKVYENNIKKYGTLTCYLCLKPISFGCDSIDHKIPISKNGTNNKSNLAIAHIICNSKKGNRLIKAGAFRNMI